MRLSSEKHRWWTVGLVIAALGAASCRGASTDNVAKKTGAVKTANGLFSNGLWTNGMTTNGLWTNGLWTNGLWTNGLWTNGLWTNGLWTNGAWENGLWTNGLWTNGLWTNGAGQNGLWTNGLWTNGLWTNGLWTNGLTGQAAVPGNTLRASRYARQLLQYVYACAMPSTTYDTFLDPNQGAPIACTPNSAPDAGAGCDDGYECSNDGQCVIPLRGAIGLGINHDGTTWWQSGSCDESCQRWVSACVLARTNAYGEHIEISMRAPDNAPQAIKDALSVTDAERNGADGGAPAYSLREGAYYGNIFATTPIDPATGKPAQYPGNDGTASGPIAATPRFFACAGPGSNIPDITRRFCSSQGDQVVITVPGVCLANSTELGTCAGADTDPASPTQGAIHDCRTGAAAAPIAPCTDYRDPSCYQQVITVYLKQPLAVCGNAVCEDGEKLDTDPGYCPSDCHPGTWANDFVATGGMGLNNAQNIGNQGAGVGAPDPNLIRQNTMFAVAPDDSIVVTGLHSLAKYNPDGSLAWGPIAANQSLSSQFGLSVGKDGRIYVLGWNTFAWLYIYSAAGAPIATLNLPNVANLNRATAVDSVGNFLFAANSSVYKISPAGAVLWTATMQADQFPTSMALDGDDNIIVADTGGHIQKLCADGTSGTSATCAASWLQGFGGTLTAVAVDTTGDVYATTVGGAVAKFAAVDGAPLWPATIAPTQVCGPWDYGLASCIGSVLGTNLAFDKAGNLLVQTFGNPSLGGSLNFGSGPFPTYRSSNMFISSYTPGGEFRWAKQIPMVLTATPYGFGVDGQGRIIVGGNYAGSMQADGHLLMTPTPASNSVVRSFLASFPEPPPTDKAPPTIGVAYDLDGNPISTMPSNIYMEATSAAGANVFFLPPTAIDDGNAGVSVNCTPRPNTVFTVGPHTVTCTASDPAGNTSSASFTVTVADTFAPVFAPATNPDPVTAPDAAGAAVAYTKPVATDQIDPAPQVTCSPPSGSTFPVGTTTVTCNAKDASNNQSQATLSVTVMPPQGPPPPPPPPQFGGKCASNDDCSAGKCVDGVCCNTTASSCGDCNACNVLGSEGTCTATSGGSCSDNNACTKNDVCQSGTCVGGSPVTCAAADQCHLAGVCDPSTGACSNPAAPNGTPCTDGNACTTGDTCGGGTCAGTVPAPTLSAGTNQTVVGTCTSAPLVYAKPQLAGASCPTGVTITCTSVPGNKYGANKVTCTAKNAAGAVSAPVSFTVTVLQPLTVRVQPPLAGDNLGVDNVVKAGSTVPAKVRLLACGTDVTRTASVTAKLAVTYQTSGGSSTTATVTSTVTCAADTNGVMTLDGTNYRYNLSTKGLSVTQGVPAFYQLNISVAYKSAPAVVAGTDAIQLDLK